MLRIAIAAVIALNFWAAPASAQTSPYDIQPNGQGEAVEANDISVRVIEQFVAVSRLPGMYANLLKYMDLIATPELRALQQEAMGSVLTPQEDIALVQRVTSLFPLISAAGADLQTGFNENRTELIQDAAELLKLVLTEAQQEKLLAFLRLGSVRKVFDALYASVEYPASWTVQDSQAIARFERWAQTLEDSLPARKKPLGEALTAADIDPDRLNAAKALVADALRVTRFEEIRNTVTPFLKDTLLPRANWMTGIDRQNALADLNAFEGDYAALREEWLAKAPLELAAALSPEQLQELHDFIKTDTASKFFDYVFKAVQSVTAITGADIDELQAFMKAEEELFAAADLPPETRKAAELQLQGLGLKWLFTLSESISPQTRNKLLAEWMAMSMETLPR